MADSGLVLGNRVYCHSCQHEWDRSQGGLQCPECDSEFVEVIEPGTRSDDSHTSFSDSPPPIPPHPLHGNTIRSSPLLPHHHPLHDHDPWASAPDPEEGDITTFEFNTGRGRGTFSYSTRTYTYGGNGRSPDPAADAVARNFESMLANMLGGGRDTRGPPTMMGGGVFQMPAQQGARGFATQPPSGAPPDLFSMFFPTLQTSRQPGRYSSPLDFLGMLLNPGNGQQGDAVFTQEAFDRVMTQLMEQNQGSGAPPASEDAISSLKKKPVSKEMMGNDGKAECSICMDNVEIGDEVTFLPCNHWFHEDCVVSWLKEHDTCPHCRQPITNPDNTNQQTSSRRRSRRSSSIASPLAQPPEEESSRYGHQVMDSPSGLRDARASYYGNSRSHDRERPRSEHNTGNRSSRDAEQSQGGVGGWIRSRMPF